MNDITLQIRWGIFFGSIIKKFAMFKLYMIFKKSEMETNSKYVLLNQRTKNKRIK